MAGSRDNVANVTRRVMLHALMTSTSGAAQARNAPAHSSAGERFRLDDLWGGLAAMLVAFPSAIAYGVVVFSAASPSLAGAGAFAGIVGAAILGIVAPLVGRNGGFITAPCAPAAAVLAGMATDLAARGRLSTADLVALISLTAIVSAAMQIVYGLVRAGRLIKFIPYQVVTGYLSGVAVIIAVAQLPQLLGVPSGVHLANALVNPQRWRWAGIAVGIVTIAAAVIAPRLTRRVPASIIALAAGVATYFGIALFRPELQHASGNPLVIGPLHATGSLLAEAAGRISAVTSMRMADLLLIAAPAVTLSVLLSIDTLKTGVILDALTRRRHNSNRELIAQGVANAASSLAGGMSGSATMGPTLVNVTSGGRTLWSGAIEGSLVLIAFLALRPLMAWVPIAALAGILLVVAWKMFDFKIFRLLFLPSARLDFVVIVAVIVVAEGVGLIQATVVGVFLAVLLFVRNQIQSSVIARKSDLSTVRSNRLRPAEEAELLHAHGSEALFVQLKDDLFFGTTDKMFSDLEGDLTTRRFLLFDFRRVQSMDYTAVHLFLQMQERMHDAGGQVLFSGMPSKVATHQDIEHYISQLGLFGTSRIMLFETRDAAVEWMEERVLERAGWPEHQSAPPLSLSAIPILQGLDEDAIAALTSHVREVSVEEGGRIFGIGDHGDELFFIRRGRVHIYLPLPGGKRHHLATFCRGEFFGEMAFLDRATRSADGVAARPTDLYVMSRSEFDALSAHDQLLATLLFERLARGIAQRLRVANTELQILEDR